MSHILLHIIMINSPMGITNVYGWSKKKKTIKNQRNERDTDYHNGIIILWDYYYT